MGATAACYWDGPDPPRGVDCLFSVDLLCKPCPAESFGSPEAGRLLLSVVLRETEDKKNGEGAGLQRQVESVVAKITNKAKEGNLDRFSDGSLIRQPTSLSTELKGSDRAEDGL